MSFLFGLLFCCCCSFPSFLVFPFRCAYLAHLPPRSAKTHVTHKPAMRAHGDKNNACKVVFPHRTRTNCEPQLHQAHEEKGAKGGEEKGTTAAAVLESRAELLITHPSPAPVADDRVAVREVALPSVTPVTPVSRSGARARFCETRFWHYRLPKTPRDRARLCV